MGNQVISKEPSFYEELKAIIAKHRMHTLAGVRVEVLATYFMETFTALVRSRDEDSL